MGFAAYIFLAVCFSQATSLQQETLLQLNSLLATLQSTTSNLLISVGSSIACSLNLQTCPTVVLQAGPNAKVTCYNYVELTNFIVPVIAVNRLQCNQSNLFSRVPLQCTGDNCSNQQKYFAQFSVAIQRGSAQNALVPVDSTQIVAFCLLNEYCLLIQNGKMVSVRSTAVLTGSP